jgi:phosphopantothenate-cysteine ligase
MPTAPSSPKNSDEHVPVSFQSGHDASFMSQLRTQLDSFVVEHALTHHRPVALVSSGGTACDLDGVRCLENFSTGTRGATAVEEFLRRGYAVVHLWRRGSASPFARVVAQQIDVEQAANNALSVDSLGKLFVTGVDEEEPEEQYIKTVLREENKFYTSPDDELSDAKRKSEHDDDDENTATAEDVRLHRTVLNSNKVRQALQDRSAAIKENRLLTIPFRTVEEYLARLEYTAQSLADCQSLAICFLAAAVSDFYIPQNDRAEQKIQSTTDGLTLHLKSVPKTIGLLRKSWAPNAFVVSFKLETKLLLLRQKAERAVEQYGCHFVIANLLQSRHEKVWLLAPEDQRQLTPTKPSDWTMTEIKKPPLADSDVLECLIIDAVVRAHFEFISWHFHMDGSSVKAAEAIQQRLREKKKRVQREELKQKARVFALQAAGAAMFYWITYTITAVLQKRARPMYT